MEILIRPVNEKDVLRIQELIQELGYDLDIDTIERKIFHIPFTMANVSSSFSRNNEKKRALPDFQTRRFNGAVNVKRLYS